MREELKAGYPFEEKLKELIFYVRRNIARIYLLIIGGIILALIIILRVLGYL